MGAYITRRVLWMFVLLSAISLITFIIFYILPSADPALLRAGRGASSELVASIRDQLGLDEPWYVQYWTYMKNVVLHFDFGYSYFNQISVKDQIFDRLPATITLGIGAMIIWLLVGIPIGIIAAVKQGKWPDHVARFLSLIGTSMPVFWLGLLLAYVLTYKFQIFPRSGQLDVGMRRPPQVTGFISIDSLLAGDTETFKSLIRHIILPAIVLGSFAMGIISRMLRSSLVAALNDDYVRTARAKGVSEFRVVRGHALRNALIPTITVIGLTFASLLAGAVLTETIFSWPGLGQFAVRMALKLDYPGLIGVTLVVAVVYIIIYFFVVVLYGVLDPRIRVG